MVLLKQFPNGQSGLSTAQTSAKTNSSTDHTAKKPTRKQLWQLRKHIYPLPAESKLTNKPTVVVLQPAELSEQEKSILSKGLSFVPTKNTNETQFFLI